MPRGNAQAVALGPGYLYIAPLTTAEPVDLTTAWGVGWTALGYTAEGSTQSYAPSYEDVTVAEELDPIDSVATGRVISVGFQLVELTAANLKIAMNGGTITTGTGLVTFEPPDLGEEVQTMIGFESEDHLERWVWRQCKQVGTVETARRKGAEKAGIPADFRAYVPAAGGKPFKRLSNRGDGVV